MGLSAKMVAVVAACVLMVWWQMLKLVALVVRLEMCTCRLSEGSWQGRGTLDSEIRPTS
jgi:hypothetical protein